jgi:hypothetical protein
MRIIGGILAWGFVALLLVGGVWTCSYTVGTRNVEAAKRCAPALLRQQGFDIVGYQGFETNVVYGGFAWYSLKKIPDNGIFYEASVSPWFGECMFYSLKAKDAIKP